MRNTIVVYNIFKNCDRVKKDFNEWVKDSEVFSDYDLERLEIDLYFPFQDNSDRCFYLHKGILLGYLESKGYYICYNVTGKFKYVSCFYFKSDETEITDTLYSQSGFEDSQEALEKAVTSAIKHLEAYLSYLEYPLAPKDCIKI